MLVSNRITKLHTFLVLVMCLKYQSSLASYGFEMNLLYPYGVFQVSRHSEKVKMLFLLNFKSCSVHKTRASFYTPHSMVLLASLMPLQVDLTPYLLSQHIAPSAAL